MCFYRLLFIKKSKIKKKNRHEDSRHHICILIKSKSILIQTMWISCTYFMFSVWLWFSYWKIAIPHTQTPQIHPLAHITSHIDYLCSMKKIIIIKYWWRPAKSCWPELITFILFILNDWEYFTCVTSLTRILDWGQNKSTINQKILL